MAKAHFSARAAEQTNGRECAGQLQDKEAESGEENSEEWDKQTLKEESGKTTEDTKSWRACQSREEQ